MMKFLSVAAAGALLAAPVFAQEAAAKKLVHRKMNLATGELTKVDNSTRFGGSLWQCETTTGFFTNRGTNTRVLDWGDVGTPNTAVGVGAYDIAYCSSGLTVDVQNQFFQSENGFQVAGRATQVAGFSVTGLPGGTGGTTFNVCWIITLDLEGQALDFSMTSGDFDVVDGNLPNFSGAGLGDFGYDYASTLISGGVAFGPLICTDSDANNPGSTTAPGIEDVFDRFSGGPALNWPTYDGAFFFGGPPVFAQFWMEIYAPNGGGGGPSCPNNLPGCDNSDIFPDGALDCIVNLSDLGVVLSNFAPGVPGKTRAQGDIFPLGGTGDGIVDLSDLGQMLTDFNTNCQ